MQNIVLKFNVTLTFISSIILNTFINLREQHAAGGAAFKSIEMASNTAKYNLFTFFKLPSAWWCGIRLKTLADNEATVSVRHRWFNQNPFKSMFWAVQGMAAEFTTGVLVSNKIKKSGRNFSMLVASNNATFLKKARGKITFSCQDGNRIDETLKIAIATGEGQTIWMKSVGLNEEGVTVSEFNFEWTLKLKNS